MLKVLAGFHNPVTRRITRMTAKRGACGDWYYTSVVELLESAGIYPIGLYIKRRQAAIADRVACRPIYESCTEAEQMPGTSQMVQWWNQDALNEPG